MADISSTVKKTWMRGMEVVGDAFDRLAANTRLRVAEMNLSNQRKEILDGFGMRAYQMWKEGASLPPELEELLRKVSELEKQLAEVRAERFRSGIPEDQPQAEETAGEPDAAEASGTPTDPAAAGEPGNAEETEEDPPEDPIPDESAGEQQ